MNTENKTPSSGLKKPTNLAKTVIQARLTKTQSTQKAADKSPVDPTLDPIDAILKARETHNLMGNQITDAEAKKKGIPVFKAEKLPAIKAGPILDFTTPTSSTKEVQPKTGIRSAATGAGKVNGSSSTRNATVKPKS